jgi:superfamily II DNA or RNA helicase
MVNGILNRRGYVIQKTELTSKQLTDIKKELTVRPYTPENDEPTFEIFRETSTSITLPRYYGLKLFGQPKKENLRLKSETSNFKFNGQLRDYQIEIVNKCVNAMKKDGGGLLSVPCGYGKTVMAIKMAAELKAKTLVIVHKTFLQDQWIERAKQFTDAKIGFIRQDQIDVEGKDIVIGMIQSISMKDYDLAIFKDFKLVVLDEAHHCASRVFSNALYKCGAKYTLALSATPERADKLTKVLHWYVGETLHKVDAKINKQVDAKIFYYKSNDPLFVEKKAWSKGQMKPSVPKMVNNLCNMKERTNHILNILETLRKNPERKILILSKKKDHLKILKTSTDLAIKNDIANGKLLEDECITSYYVGGMKKKDAKYATDKADILFATYDMAHEGLDIERLNTIILATPKKNVIQSVGRIMRKILTTGDLKPLIIDFSDHLSVFTNQSNVRIKQYAKNKYKVRKYYIKNDKIVLPSFLRRNDNNFIGSDMQEDYNPDITNILNMEVVTAQDLLDNSSEESVESDCNDDLDESDDDEVEVSFKKPNFKSYMFETEE